jgi:hypothetical protein
MLRFFFPALALAGVLAAAQPCFADPAFDRVQAAAASEQASPEPATPWSSDAAIPATQPASSEGASSWSSDAAAQSAAGTEFKAAPVGFGWG